MTTLSQHRRAGFTLLEVMLVIMIIGVIAIIAINNLDIVGTSDKARRTATETLIGQLSTAVNRYYLDVGKMPPSLDALISNPGEQNWGGPYLQKIKPDAWGDAFTFSSSGRSFEIRSGGGGSEGGPISSNDL
ncbi:MAG: type II secretion system protein GspG [Kiritimatiellia bacterium]